MKISDLLTEGRAQKMSQDDFSAILKKVAPLTRLPKDKLGASQRVEGGRLYFSFTAYIPKSGIISDKMVVTVLKKAVEDIKGYKFKFHSSKTTSWPAVDETFIQFTVTKK